MRDFNFINPTKLIFGRDSIEMIVEEMALRGHKKVLLVAGGGSIRKNGVYDRVVHSLDGASVEYVEVWGVRANPVLKKVRKMISIASENNVDAVLAVGGGSVVDSGKAVAAGVCMTCDVWQAFEDKKSVEKALPVYCVLTISATGTEMNGNAVVSNEAEKKKWHITGPALYPVVSAVDPSVQSSLPFHQTVNGAIDAMSHIMEYYFVGGCSETTLSVDEALMRTIIRMVDALSLDPCEYDSRANLAWAATLALNGISGAGLLPGDWASHGIECSISAIKPDIAHGCGLGVIFPAWILYCKDVDPWIFERWAGNVWGAATVEEGVALMRAKFREWGAPVTLGQLGIDVKDIPNIADNAVLSGRAGAVKILAKKDIMAILELAA